MKTHNRTAGYSINTAKHYINTKQAIYCLSDELESQVKFENNQPTGEVIAYKAWFSQKGLPPFQVKFESEVPLPSYLAMVDFDILKHVKLVITFISAQMMLKRLNNG